jgi:hypothetical protein
LLSSFGGGEDKSWKGEVDKMGTNKAAVAFQTARNFQDLPAKARQIEAGAALAAVEVERQQAIAEANAIVSAAAAGTTGGSVDATIGDTKRSAAEARGQIERERLAGHAQLEREYEDAFWAGDAAKYQYQYTPGQGTSTGTKLLTAALSGAGAYFAGRK